ncbi:MAG TPA: LysM peptidoglycan-binding domain-containing protein [Planctomycetota bacterium]|nr:LysM peptidoglycan-binding domain-containing protein [Planctomycetota bacterium]
MRKDAKIALIVILALMVLVVVIWGRSPRPDDTVATPSPIPEAVETSDIEALAPSKADADAAAHDAPGSPPTDHSSSFMGDTAMMNHLQPPDRATMRHEAGAPTEDNGALRARDAGRDPTPAALTDSAALESRADPTPPPKPAITHTVAKGDTLIGLAIRYYKDQTKWRLIQQANKGVAVLQIGQKLTIPPLPDAPPKATDTVTPKPPDTGKRATDKPSLDRPAKPAPAAPTPARRKTYTVQRGDTFIKIARSVYRDPGKWRTLYERNRAKLPNPAKPDSLRPGTVLEVPALASSN